MDKSSSKAEQARRAQEHAAKTSVKGRNQALEGYLVSALLIIGAVLFVGVLWYLDTNPPGSKPHVSSGKPQAALADKPAQSAEVAIQASQPSVTAPAKQDVEAEIRRSVMQWAEAWSRRDTAAYLSFYADGFKIPQGMSRTAWEAQRKSKLTKYKSIEVTLKNINVSYSGGDAASVSFIQDFRADRFREMGTKKELSLKKIQDRWLIVSETAR